MRGQREAAQAADEALEAARRARQAAAITDDQTAIPSLGGGDGARGAVSEGSGDEWEGGASDEEGDAASGDGGGSASAGRGPGQRSHAVNAFYAALSRRSGAAAEPASASAAVRRAAALPPTAQQAMAQLQGVSLLLGEGSSLVDDLAPQPVRGAAPKGPAARSPLACAPLSSAARCVHSSRRGRRTWPASWRTWPPRCSGTSGAWRGWGREPNGWSPLQQRAGTRMLRAGAGGSAPCGGGSGTRAIAYTPR